MTSPISKTLLFHEDDNGHYYVAQFKTAELAIFSYYVESDKQALVIDPTYDVYPYQQLAKKRGAQIKYVLLTHYHADFLSGQCNFNHPIIMGPKSDRPGVPKHLQEQKDLQTFKLGHVTIKTIHTPGHTTESSTFQLIDKEGKSYSIFTGDTIFLNQVGRPDLAASKAQKGHPQLTVHHLAKMLFHSIHKLMNMIPKEARIYPGHGSGSSCGKSIGQGNFCTFGKQMQNNYALQIKDQQQFIQTVTKDLPPAPKYFFHDAHLNQTQTGQFDQICKKSLNKLNIEQFQQELKNGSIIIDTRPVLQGGSIKPSLLMNQKGNVATWMGVLVQPHTGILIFSDPNTEKDIIERLLRIGYFNIKGYNGFTIKDWKQKGLDTYESKIITGKQFSEVKQYNIIDVRKPGEWKETGVIHGAITVTLADIEKRVQQFRGKDNLYINCRGGFRARVASSYLSNAGIKSTIVNQEFKKFAEYGVKISPHA